MPIPTLGATTSTPHLPPQPLRFRDSVGLGRVDLALQRGGEVAALLRPRDLHRLPPSRRAPGLDHQRVLAKAPARHRIDGLDQTNIRCVLEPICACVLAHSSHMERESHKFVNTFFGNPSDRLRKCCSRSLSLGFAFAFASALGALAPLSLSSRGTASSRNC